MKDKIVKWSGWVFAIALLFGMFGQHFIAAASSPTGHEVAGQFQTAYNHFGGLAILGYALSDPYMGQTEDSQTRLVQVFERGAIEYHPENDSANQYQFTRAYALHREIWPPSVFCSFDELRKQPWVKDVNIVDQANGHAMVTVRGNFQVPPGWEVDKDDLHQQHYPAQIPAKDGDVASFWAPQCNTPAPQPQPKPTQPPAAQPTTKPISSNVCSVAQLQAQPWVTKVEVLSSVNGQAKVTVSGQFDVPTCNGKSWEVDWMDMHGQHAPSHIPAMSGDTASFWAPDTAKPLK